MEIKATLNKPYTENEKLQFIINNNDAHGYEIRETKKALEAWGYTEQELADKREADFKSKFFNIEGYGWYRKQPKGYQSAIESLNTAFNRFTVMQKMGIEVFPANVFIFYAQPDFTKPEECTEEWLIAHQTKNEEMTVQKFGSFYATFTDAWNTEEHE